MYHDSDGSVALELDPTTTSGTRNTNFSAAAPTTLAATDNALVAVEGARPREIDFDSAAQTATARPAASGPASVSSAETVGLAGSPHPISECGPYKTDKEYDVRSVRSFSGGKATVTETQSSSTAQVHGFYLNYKSGGTSGHLLDNFNILMCPEDCPGFAH